MTNRRIVVSVTIAIGTLTPVAVLAGYPTPNIAGNAKYVTDFGARCDGSTDDRAALQKALNAVRNGGQLVFPKNDVCITKGHLKLNNGNGWQILGQGATIKMHASIPGTGKRPPNWILSTLNNINFDIYDLNLHGNAKERKMPPVESGQQNAAHNLKIWEGKNFKLVRVTAIDSAMDGILIGANNPNPSNPARTSRDGLLHQVETLNSWRIGLTILNGEDIVIEDGVFANSRGDWPQAGIDIEANRLSYTPSSKNITIRNNAIYGNEGFGIQLANRMTPRDITIEDNYLSDNERGAIQANGVDVSIRRNLFQTFTDDLAPAQKFTTPGVVALQGGSTRVSVEDNTFETVHNYGTALLYVSNNSGTGHTFVGNCIADVGIAEIWDRRGKVSPVNNEFRNSCPNRGW